ncbi:hypothetical protein ACFE04_012434 [Oxalis oulophora]
MAPTLTSTNTFLITSIPRSRLTNFKKPRLTVFAKRTPDDNSVDAESSGNVNGRFRFDFGKINDNIKSLVPIVSSNPAGGQGLSFGNRRKDSSTVFVAGATGQAGIRIAQSLLRRGFSVRAGVPQLGAAQQLASLAAQYKIISQEESKRLNAVESTFQDAESIAKAIGNASKVVVTIGPTENGPTTEVSPSDALQVIEAAELAGVDHVAIIYDESFVAGSSYNVLDGITSFFNNIFSQTQPLTVTEFLQKVIETDISYTFIKAKLAEDFGPEKDYNVVVSAEGKVDAANEYKVAKAQIASLVASVLSNTDVAENKVVEVYADPSAPSKKIDELFSTIPEDGRRKIYAETLAKQKAEEEARSAQEKAREATRKLEKESKKPSVEDNVAEEAQENGTAASMENLVGRVKDIQFSWEKFSTQLANGVPKTEGDNEKPKVQIATVRGQAKARNLAPQKAAVKQQPGLKFPSFKLNATPAKPKPKPKTKEVTKPAKGKETEVRKVFGGLFKQETIYIDED